jgi:hypothetical protein
MITLPSGMSALSASNDGGVAPEPHDYELLFARPTFALEGARRIKIAVSTSIKDEGRHGLKKAWTELRGLPIGVSVSAFGSVLVPEDLEESSRARRREERAVSVWNAHGVKLSQTVWELYDEEHLKDGIDTITLSVPAHLHGNFTLYLSAVAMSMSGGVRRRTIAMPVAITPVNDPPVITVPNSGPQLVYEGTESHQLPYRSVRVMDEDLSEDGPLGKLVLRLSVTHGWVSSGPSAPASELEFAGSEFECNEFLANISYYPRYDFNGEIHPSYWGNWGDLGSGDSVSDTISITADDDGHSGTGSGSVQQQATIPVFLVPINDPPTISFSPPIASGAGLVLNATEDTPFTVPVLVVTDPDIGNHTMKVVLKVSAGMLRLDDNPEALAAAAGHAGVGWSAPFAPEAARKLTIQASLHVLNAALRHLTYLPAANYAGIDTLSARVSDLGHSGVGATTGFQEAPLVVPVAVASVNDPPRIIFTARTPSLSSGSIELQEDARVRLAGLVVADVDAGARPLRLKIHTMLSVEEQDQLLSFASSSSNSRNVTSLNDTMDTVAVSYFTKPAPGVISVVAPVVTLNRLLQSLYYRPPLNYHGSDTLYLVVEDPWPGTADISSGMPGAGTFNVTRELQLLVHPANDAPVITVDTEQLYVGEAAENCNRAEKVACSTAVLTSENVSVSLAGLTVSDIDVASDTSAELLLTVSASWGVLSFTEGTGRANDRQALLRMQAPITQLNTALAGLFFFGGETRSGQAVVTVTVNDLGYSGTAGVSAMPMTAIKLVQVHVEPVPTVPVCDLPAKIDAIEGLSVRLPLRARLVDVDGSETLDVLVTGVPKQMQLAGARHIENTTWSLSQIHRGRGAEYITMLPTAVGYGDVEFDLQVECRTTEKQHMLHGRGDNASHIDTVTASITRITRVRVEARADTPLLEVGVRGLGTVVAVEDEWFQLHLQSHLRDADGSESLEIRIGGLPEDAVFGRCNTTAADVGAGPVFTALSEQEKAKFFHPSSAEWVLPSSARELQLTSSVKLGQDAVAPFKLNVTATATEQSNTDSASLQAVLHIGVEAVPDKPLLSVSTVSGDDDGEPIVLDIAVDSGSVTHSETLQLLLAGVPEHAVVSPATKIGTEGGVSMWNIHLANYTTPPAAVCPAGTDTGGDCNILVGCYSWRGPTECISGKCVCRAGFCSTPHASEDGNTCTKLDWKTALSHAQLAKALTITLPRKGDDQVQCSRDTGGRCRFAQLSSRFGCHSSRSAQCVEGRCECKVGECAAGGVCVPKSKYTLPRCLALTAIARSTEPSNERSSAALEAAITVVIADDYTPADKIGCLGNNWNGCPPEIDGKPSFKCSNGACVMDTQEARSSAVCMGEDESTGNGCPAGLPHKCTDGRCIGVGEDCDVFRRCFGRQNCKRENRDRCGEGRWCGLNGCPLTEPYRCADGVCTASQQVCGARAAGVVLCGKASSGRCLHGCVDAWGRCPSAVLVECEDGEIRCRDGSCVSDESECMGRRCPLQAPVRCADGSCAVGPIACIQVSGSRGSGGACSVDKPLRCAHGLCVARPAECSSTLSIAACVARNATVCPDGTCDMDGLACSPLPPCPMQRPSSCWDGSCAETPALCPMQQPSVGLSVNTINDMESGRSRNTQHTTVEPTLHTVCPSSVNGMAVLRCADGSCRPLLGTQAQLNATAPGFSAVADVNDNDRDRAAAVPPEAVALSCLPSNRCPLSSPYQCWDGACRSNFEACSHAGGCAPGEQPCAEGGECTHSALACASPAAVAGASSGEEGPLLARFRTPLSFSKVFSQAKEAAITVVDTMGAALAEVSVPARAFNCSRATGGTCRLISCFSWRGPTDCVNSHCRCQSGHCAVNGKCISEDLEDDVDELTWTGGTYEVRVSAVPSSALPSYQSARPTYFDRAGDDESSFTLAEVSAVLNLTTDAFDDDDDDDDESEKSTAATEFPTSFPTIEPTKYPTAIRTAYPTAKPSSELTKYPTSAPTSFPTSLPTSAPTGYPTASTRRLMTDKTRNEGPSSASDKLALWKAYMRTNLQERAAATLREVRLRVPITLTFKSIGLDHMLVAVAAKLADQRDSETVGHSDRYWHELTSGMACGQACLGCLREGGEHNGGMAHWECCGELSKQEDGSLSSKVSTLAVYAVIEKRTLQSLSLSFVLQIPNITVATFWAHVPLFQSTVARVSYVSAAAVNISHVVAFGASSKSQRRVLTPQNSTDMEGSNWGVSVKTHVLVPTNSSKQALNERLQLQAPQRGMKMPSATSPFLAELAVALSDSGWSGAVTRGKWKLSASSLVTPIEAGSAEESVDGQSPPAPVPSSGAPGTEDSSGKNRGAAAAAAIAAIVMLAVATVLVRKHRLRQRRDRDRGSADCKDEQPNLAKSASSKPKERASEAEGGVVILAEGTTSNPMTVGGDDSEFTASNPLFGSKALRSHTHEALRHQNGESHVVSGEASGAVQLDSTHLVAHQATSQAV